MKDKKTLLIVDDDVAHRTMLRILLDWEKFKIIIKLERYLTLPLRGKALTGQKAAIRETNRRHINELIR